MTEIIISGKFLVAPMSGIPRYAREIILNLDKIVSPGEISIIVPKGYKDSIDLMNIDIVEKSKKYIGWDFFVVERYARKRKALYVSFSNNGGFYKKSLVCLHDMRPFTWKEEKFTFKTMKLKIKLYITSLLSILYSRAIITISEFSKNQITSYFKLKNKPFEIVYPGWEHLNRIENTDIEVDNNFSDKDFFFSISSIAPHKNFKWVIEIAKNHPHYNFVIAGKIYKELWNVDFDVEKYKNIFYLGYITDEKMKTYLSKCKALLFPSFYEGFGIPPLEALALNKPSIVADIPVLREVFGDTVYYIDPNDYNISLDEVMLGTLDCPNEVLTNCSWEKAASQCLDLFRKYK